MRGISIILTLALVPGLAFATVIPVGPSQPWTTIQSGINAAISGDTVLVTDGTYTGSANKNLNFGGRDIVLMSANGPENCIIDCERSGTGFFFHSGETAASVVSGFTIKNGSYSNGAGVCITNSSPTFRYCVISNNISSNYGGGFYVTNGNPTIQNCSICYNDADYGGGIYVGNSNLVINSCIISGNTADGGG